MDTKNAGVHFCYTVMLRGSVHCTLTFQTPITHGVLNIHLFGHQISPLYTQPIPNGKSVQSTSTTSTDGHQMIMVSRVHQPLDTKNDNETSINKLFHCNGVLTSVYYCCTNAMPLPEIKY